MSSSGAVYQPTTVTYDDHVESSSTRNHRSSSSSGPIGFLASAIGQRTGAVGVGSGTGGPCFPNRNVFSLAVLVTCIGLFALGLVMVIHGAMGYVEAEEEREAVYLVVTVFGAIFFALSVLLLVFFMRLTRRICWRGGKDHMSTSNGQNLTVNPSTDFLVTAQYAPVSEVVYQPAQEDTEQSKLMPSEKLDLTNEDTDRMVERDPRIVLRPLNSSSAHEET